MFVKKIYDVQGLLVQMHPRRKNTRIVGWVGRFFERFSTDLMSSQSMVANPREEMNESSTRHLAYTKDFFSEFLTPSRRSHPHVEPLLAPYEFLDKQARGYLFYESSRNSFPLKTHNP